MRKVWIYQRKNVKGWWVGWLESGKRKAKVLPSKVLAEHFRQIKYNQLNSDVFTGTVKADWLQMVQEYEQSKCVAGFTDTAIYEAMLTLRHFTRLIGPCNSKQITQSLLDRFILARDKEVKRYTVNKDISNLKAFIRWAHENRYIDSQLKLKKRKMQQQPIVVLSNQQIKTLLQIASEYPGWRLRVLLAVTTGLRRGDIEVLRVGDIHFDRDSITTKSKKTGKTMAERPMPAQVITELANYIATLPDGQERLFSTSRRWETIRIKAGLSNLKFHDLRKTFASTLVYQGVSTAVTQRLLEHSDPRLTTDFYINAEPALRQAVDKLPVEEWLR